MSVSDSLISSGSDSASEKKKTTTNAPEHKDATEQHSGTTGDSTTDHGSDDHSAIHATKLDDVNKDTWGGWAWKSMVDGYKSLTGEKTSTVET